MKHFLIAGLSNKGFLVVSNSNDQVSTEPLVQKFMNFGDSTFSIDGAISAASMVESFETKGDTMYGTVAGEITKVCTVKGCWMATAIDSNNNIC